MFNLPHKIEEFTSDASIQWLPKIFHDVQTNNDFNTSRNMDSSHTFPFKLEKPKIDPNEIPGRKDLLAFFNREGLSKFIEVFPLTVNFDFFKTMGEDDFVEYGVTKEEDLQTLLSAVKQAQDEEDNETDEVSLSAVW